MPEEINELHVIRIKNENSTDGYHSVYLDKFKAHKFMKRWQEAYPDMNYYVESTTDFELVKYQSNKPNKPKVEIKFPESIGTMEIQK